MSSGNGRTPTNMAERAQEITLLFQLDIRSWNWLIGQNWGGLPLRHFKSLIKTILCLCARPDSYHRGNAPRLRRLQCVATEPGLVPADPVHVHGGVMEQRGAFRSRIVLRQAL